METLTGNTQFEVIVSLSSIRRLLNSRILESSKYEVFRYAVLTEVLVSLHYLLDLSEKKFSKRISFTDDVIIRKYADPKKSIYDISDLVRAFRDGACHINSGRRYFGKMDDSKGQKSFFSFLVGLGQMDMDISFEPKYEDDVAYFMGKEVLYLNRHIKRAFDELKIFYSNYLPDHLMKFINGDYGPA